MILKSKGLCILYIAIGVILTVASAYLFLSEPSPWQGIMLLVGLFWLWIGVSNLRRLQNTGGK